MQFTTRTRNIITGMIAVVLVTAAVSVGVKAAFGAYRDVYKITASFEAAGQGLQKGSDVKVRGVNIGRVSRVQLVDGRALVTMQIDSGRKVPETAEAVIRPKTLFGEKFVDLLPGEGESDGPFLRDGGTVEHTQGGFELERVLGDAYPILKAINPDELATVLMTLADAAEGEGEAINRQLVNGQILLDINAAHDDDTRRLLQDLAALAQELAGRADDVVQGAKDLNQALPVLNEHPEELNALLSETSRLAGDLADLIEANEDFVTDSVVRGGESLQVLYDQRDNIVPLVIGLREYVQTLSEVIRIPVGDGTYMAAVHGLLAGDVCLVIPGCPATGSAEARNAAIANGIADPALLGQLANQLGSLLPGNGSNAGGNDLVQTIVGGLLNR